MSTVIGVDVCKAFLDFSVLEGRENWLVPHLRVPNTAAGIAEIKRAAARHGVDLVVCEATGGYERALVRSGLPVARVTPNQIKGFATANNRWAKTDRIDARLIAVFGERMRPDVTADVSPYQLELKAAVELRTSTVVGMTALKNRLRILDSKFAKKETKRRLGETERSLKRIDDELDRLIQLEPATRERARRVQTVPGVARVLSLVLAAFLPELGMLNGKQIAALVGVAPYNNDSGNTRKTKKKRNCKAGRAAVRHTLYMCAMTAVRFEPGLKAFYEQLVARGKERKVALVACMRKLIVMLNSMLKNERDWTVERPSAATRVGS